MNSLKVVGRIAENKKDNSCRLEVLSFKKNGESIISRTEIKNQFPPYGFVFAPKFFDKYNLDINTLIEFTTSSFTPSHKSDNMDVVYMDLNRGYKLAGSRVLHLPESVLCNERSVNQPSLKQFISEEISHFYIRIGGFLYGPFKSLNHDVLPKLGQSVNKYKVAPSEYNTEGKHYVLADPEEVIDSVDCMTQTQLIQFLKDQIKNQQLKLDLNQLKKAFEMQPLEGLDVPRMKRILKNVETLSLNQQEILSLITLSEKFEILYEAALERAKEEIKEGLITPFIAEKNNLEQTINKLNASIRKLIKEEQNYISSIEKLEKEKSHLHTEKDRLIADIKVHSLINPVEKGCTALITYEEQNFSNTTKRYENLADFVELVNASILTNENGKIKYAHKILYQFKDHTCFLCDNIRVIMQIARLSNNCRMVIQQAEPNWLRFENFFNNGLSYIWDVAHQNPEMLHFLVLEDINMASIECYGRPLLDLINGIRRKLPSTDSSWPGNLWVFGVPMESTTENFGLPLLEKTFFNWGGFPINDSLSIDITVQAEAYLEISQLKDHALIMSVDKTPYFLKG